MAIASGWLVSEQPPPAIDERIAYDPVAPGMPVTKTSVRWPIPSVTTENIQN
jgi:hypothetical protein